MALLLATALATALWALLVFVAVRRGQDARAGGGAADWVLTVVVSAVAAGVLLGVLTLLPRVRDAWRGGFG